jgi:predicted DNA-binding ribbon-helix-helix protein
MPDKRIGQNISLYPEQLAVLLQVAKDNGLGNISAANRMIITDWVRLRAEKDGVQAPSVPVEPEPMA